MRACSYLFAATALLIAAGWGCASPSDNPTGTAGSGDVSGTAGTTGTAGTGGTTPPATCGPQTPPAPAGGAAFPFPQHRLSASCGYPMNCNDADVMTAWNTYKTKMITAGGAGSGLRVQRTENGNDTVSDARTWIPQRDEDHRRVHVRRFEHEEAVSCEVERAEAAREQSDAVR
jgi:hypothetical protein